jgi:hypothetical protein
LKKEPFDPQPFEQLATVLRQLGRPETATSLLYAEKNEELAQARGMTKCLVWLDWVFVGFGYYPAVAGLWILGLLGLGVLFLNGSGERRGISRASHSYEPDPFPLKGLVYSFDILVPLITLYKPDEDVILRGWVRYYFFIHRLLGWVLASFLVAGLAGLTK